MTPPALDRVVKTCLAKDPEDRWQTAHDVKLELQWIAEGGSQAGLPAPVVARRKSRESSPGRRPPSGSSPPSHSPPGTYVARRSRAFGPDRSCYRGEDRVRAHRHPTAVR